MLDAFTIFRIFIKYFYVTLIYTFQIQGKTSGIVMAAENMNKRKFNNEGKMIIIITFYKNILQYEIFEVVFHFYFQYIIGKIYNSRAFYR